MGIVIRRLEEHDEVENFDCGDNALNNYLRRHAWTNQQKSSIGVSYVALDEDAPRTVLGYFTLAMASVPRDAFPKKYVRGLPPYDLPLILLARLAVDRRFAGRGLGHALISEALRITFRVADEVGCRSIFRANKCFQLGDMLCVDPAAYDKNHFPGLRSVNSEHSVLSRTTLPTRCMSSTT